MKDNPKTGDDVSAGQLLDLNQSVCDCSPKAFLVARDATSRNCFDIIIGRGRKSRNRRKLCLWGGIA
jgi:hypothetical protein